MERKKKMTIDRITRIHAEIRRSQRESVTIVIVFLCVVLYYNLPTCDQYNDKPPLLNGQKTSGIKRIDVILPGWYNLLDSRRTVFDITAGTIIGIF